MDGRVYELAKKKDIRIPARFVFKCLQIIKNDCSVWSLQCEYQRRRFLLILMKVYFQGKIQRSIKYGLEKEKIVGSKTQKSQYVYQLSKNLSKRYFIRNIHW